MTTNLQTYQIKQTINKIARRTTNNNYQPVHGNSYIKTHLPKEEQRISLYKKLVYLFGKEKINPIRAPLMSLELKMRHLEDLF
jgi:hypothetical protein